MTSKDNTTGGAETLKTYLDAKAALRDEMKMHQDRILEIAEALGIAENVTEEPEMRLPRVLHNRKRPARRVEAAAKAKKAPKKAPKTTKKGGKRQVAAPGEGVSRKIIRFLASHGTEPVPVAEITNAVDTKSSSASAFLSNLRSRGYAKAVERGVWAATPAGVKYADELPA